MAKVQVFACDSCGAQIKESGYQVRLLAYPLLNEQELDALREQNGGRLARRVSVAQSSEEVCKECYGNMFGKVEGASAL